MTSKETGNGKGKKKQITAKRKNREAFLGWLGDEHV
jgi:hypothetical protein